MAPPAARTPHDGAVTIEYDWPALYELAWDGEGEPPAAGAGDPPAAGLPPMLPAVAGREKCTATSKQSGKRCGHWPVPGATVCKWHGGGAPQVRAAAEQRLQEAQALALARKAAGEVDVAAFGDPFSALETALAHQHALALRLLAIVEQIPDDELRYRGKMAEQLRGEVTAAQTALRDLKASAEGAMRAGAGRAQGEDQRGAGRPDGARPDRRAAGGRARPGRPAASPRGAAPRAGRAGARPGRGGGGVSELTRRDRLSARGATWPPQPG